VYNLRPGHRCLARLAEAPDSLLLFSWLFPRAAEWTLKWALQGWTGLVKCFDLREYADAIEFVRNAAGFAEALGRRSAAALENLTEPASGRWYPVLDHDRCKLCRQCVEFCLFGVYALDDRGVVRVTRPDACKTGCPACARVCPSGAIMFPHCHAEPAIAGADQPADQPPASETPAASNADLDALVAELDRLDL
jgi:Pyruvate/2-oxoacid:ferredoxin oxidoreductase delta subunit